MSEWIIYSKDGAEKCKVRSLEYNGEFLGACSVSVNISSPYPIEFEIGDWIEYRAERFELNYDPSVIKESSANTYGEGFVYDNIVFNSLSDELTRCDFLDYVREDNGMHYSSLPTFSFYAETIEALAERIEVNLDRIYTGEKKWTVEVHDEHINTKNVNISISNQTCWDALGLVKTMFDANFIIRGRRIIIGTSGIAVGNLFSYGKGNGLYKIEKNAESGQKIITRLRAYGSTKNLPASYYRNLEGGNVPNNMAVRNLMLPSFPSTLDPYIDSENIDKLGIREGTIFFDGSGDLEEIFPTLEGMTAESLKDTGIDVNATGELDVIVSAEQIEDDGIIPEEGQGELKGSFTVELKDIGFDINDYLSTEAATLSMKDGMCGGRDFEITKCEKTSTGYRLTCNRYEDTSLGLAFPYNGYQIKAGDKFVLLNIEMPDVYVKAASQRLLVAAKDYLSKNDYVRYSYTPTIDNIWVARQHEEAIANNLVSIHDTIKEGDFILFEDKDLGVQGNITIDSLTIKESAEDSVIPEYELTLKNEKTVGTIEKIQNQVSSILKGGGGSSMNTDQVSSIVKAIGSTLFLSKKKDDRSSGKIASDKGFEVGDFNEGTLGSGAATFMRDGSSYSEVDYLKVRKKATFTNITIQELKHIGGEIILSPAAMVVSKVEELEDGYKCYFDTTDYDGRKVYSYFETGDQARCRTFNLAENTYYWRLVTDVNEEEGYIVLSKTDCDNGSGIPKEGDNISQLGNRENPERQSAIVLSAYGSDAPSYKQYSGVDSFSLEGKQVTKLSPYGNELTGILNIEKGSKGWENFEGLPEEIQKAANATDILENLEYGKNNLLRNSGFTGDYLTAVLDGSTSLKDTSSMFSPSLKHWDYVKATAIEEKDYSESGKAVQIQDGGIISQTLYFKVIKDEKYIFSFRGKGGNVTYSIGGHTYMFELTDEWSQYVDKFTASNEGTIFTLNVTGNCTLCELQLERGTVKSAWGISPLDNRSELAKYDSLTYLQSALKGETDILGGLINTSLINMGMYDEGNKMTKTTAGINGLYNEERSVAFWAGGNIEQAVFTEATYLDNPNYIPTQEELNKMAKFVVTHGGRAILNDIILRGYIYALGGFFKGEVVAEKGSFKNINSEGDAFSIDKNGVATLLSGKIGKFRVDENFIGSRGDDKPLGLDGKMAMSETALAFNGDISKFFIDVNPYSESGKQHVCNMIFNHIDDVFSNKYIEFNIQGSTKGNFAFSGKGDGVLNGLQVGYGVRTITGTANTTEIIQDIHGGNNFIVVDDVNVGLPSYESVHKSLGIESGNFCVPIRVLNMQTSQIKVQGKSSSPSSMNSDKYPVVDAVFLSNGACKTFYLVYNNGTYRAFVE